MVSVFDSRAISDALTIILKHVLTPINAAIICTCRLVCRQWTAITDTIWPARVRAELRATIDCVLVDDTEAFAWRVRPESARQPPDRGRFEHVRLHFTVYLPSIYDASLWVVTANGHSVWLPIAGQDGQRWCLMRSTLIGQAHRYAMEAIFPELRERMVCE